MDFVDVSLVKADFNKRYKLQAIKISQTPEQTCPPPDANELGGKPKITIRNTSMTRVGKQQAMNTDYSGIAGMVSSIFKASPRAINVKTGAFQLGVGTSEFLSPWGEQSEGVNDQHKLSQRPSGFAKKKAAGPNSSDWLEMIKNDMSKHDSQLLKILREKDASLRDVYDIAGYYQKKGRNAKSRFSPPPQQQLLSPSKVKFTQTQRGDGFFNTTLAGGFKNLPSIANASETQIVVGSNIDSLAKQKDLQIASLMGEISLLKTENQELTALNRRLVDKIDGLQTIVDGEAPARHFYMESHHSFYQPKAMSNSPSMRKEMQKERINDKNAVQKRLDDQAKRLTNAFEKNINALKLSYGEEVEELQLSELNRQNELWKKTFKHFKGQYEQIITSYEMKNVQLTHDKDALRGQIERQDYNPEELDRIIDESEKLKQKLAVYQTKYKNIDLDILHQKLTYLQTKADQYEREKLLYHNLLFSLSHEIDEATSFYLKMRKARELEFDLPGEEAFNVDNRNWRRLLDMEKKAYLLVETCANLALAAEKEDGSPRKIGVGEDMMRPRGESAEFDEIEF